MSVKDGCIDSPWLTSPNSALADVTNSPLGVAPLPIDDVMASKDGTASEVLDLSQHQTLTVASTSSTDVSAGVTVGAVSGPGSNSSWCDVSDDDDNDTEQHMMTSLSTKTPFMKRSCAGEIFL